MRPLSCSLASLVVAIATGCGFGSSSPEDASETSSESELGASRLLHEGAVTLLASDRHRVLYAVDSARGREVLVASLSVRERVLVTFPAGEQVSAESTAGDGVFLVRHSADLGPSALGIIDLRASSPTYVDAVSANVAIRAELRGGVIVYTTPADGAESNLFVRTPDGVTRQAPGTAWGDRYRLSADGRKLAYWSNGTLTQLDTRTGATVTAPLEGKFDFVNGALFAASGAELYRFDDVAASRFYRLPVASPEIAWWVRADGQLLVSAKNDSAAHYGYGAQMWLVDPATGADAFYARDPGKPGPDLKDFRYVVSDDGRYLLNWYPQRGTVGDVWMHDLGAPLHARSTKLLEGVSVGFPSGGAGGVGFNHATSLRARCEISGGFVRCTPSDKGQAVVFAIAAPSSPLPTSPNELAPDGAAGCTVARGSIVCASSDGTSTEIVTESARLPRGDRWFGGRLVFEGRDAATGGRYLGVADPKSAAIEKVVETSCGQGAFTTSTTPSRLFVADCSGLRAVR